MLTAPTSLSTAAGLAGEAAKLRVAFRTDASLQIGTGHVMRCLTLANALREQGVDCTFVCRTHSGHMGEQITASGHNVHLLPQVEKKGLPDERDDLYAHWLGCTWEKDAEQTVEMLVEDYDWLVVDHYGLDARWESALRDKVKRILAIDDLANRPHDCDLLLDQNLGREAQDYDGLVGAKTQRLIGPSYALLRLEFAKLREYSLQRRQTPQLKTLLVSMGGVDTQDATGRVLEVLKRCPLPTDCRIIVVMGQQAPWLQRVQVVAEDMPWSCEVRVNVTDMARLMADSDLAIGAAGSTSWERCCLGLPTLVIVLADNQRSSAASLEKAGAAYTINNLAGFEQDILAAFEKLKDHSKLFALSQAGLKVCDGWGMMRVAKIIG